VINQVQTDVNEGLDGLVGFTNDFLNQFSDFKSRFNKTYESEEAEGKALLNIANLLPKIQEHNDNYNSGSSSFQLGIWEYSDMSADDISENMTGFVSKPKEKTVFKNDYPADVPPYVNYTQAGLVSRIMNQGICGGCWAFSAIGAWEGQIAKKTGQLVKLSEQNLIDCNKDQEQGNWGCGGGDMKTVYEFIKGKGHGINSAQSYRYKGQDNYACAYNPQKSVATIEDYVEVETGNETLLMQALAHVGPLAIAVDASSDTFQNYHGGVYNDPACSTKINHAVVLVGYGIDHIGGEYWLVRNSWGPSYGENGYIRIARNRGNLCGVASEISYPLV
jgi:C1A family cysteine protease